MFAGNSPEVAESLDATEVISATGCLTTFDLATVEHLTTVAERMHAEIINDTCEVSAEVLRSLIGAVRILADVRDTLLLRTRSEHRGDLLLLGVMEAFDQVGVDRLCPAILTVVLERLEPSGGTSVKALQRQLGGYGVQLRNNRAGLTYLRLIDVQQVAGISPMSRRPPRLLIECDEYFRSIDRSTVHLRDMKAALTAKRPVLSSISENDFAQLLRTYGVCSYWQGDQCRIVRSQVCRALSQFDAPR